MKTTTLILILCLTGFGLWAQPMPPNVRGPFPRVRTNNPATMVPGGAAVPLPTLPSGMPGSLPSAPPSGPGGVANGAGVMTPGGPGAMSPMGAAAPSVEVPGYDFTYEGVDVNQVLDVYAGLVNRTLLRSGNLPQASIVLKTQQKLTKSEAIEALQAV